MFGLILGTGRYRDLINKSELRKTLDSDTGLLHEVRTEWFTCLIYKPAALNTGNRHYIAGDGVELILDGYLIHRDGYGPIENHLRKVAEDIREDGWKKALDNIRAGAFNLVAWNVKNKTCLMFNDRIGAHPLYLHHGSSGLLFTSHLNLIHKSGWVNLSPDVKGCAETIFFGHTISNRTMVESFRQLPQSSVVDLSVPESPLLTRYELTEEPAPGKRNRSETIDTLNELLKQSVRRIHSISGNTANLQSAGMDSRLLSALWPESEELTCYTYGNLDSYEVEIARQIAELRGAGFRHVRPSGDDVSVILDGVFDTVANYIYPDRYFIAKKIASYGHEGLLDGFLGDVILGGTYFANDKYSSDQVSKALRFLTRFKDSKLKPHSSDELSVALFEEMQTFHENELGQYFQPETCEALRQTKEDIYQDIYADVEKLRNRAHTLGELFRDYKMSNRARMSIVKQGVNCRRFVEVYYPYTNDFDFFEYAMQIPAEQLAYRRLYIDLFRKFYKSYAAIPLGSSQIALHHSPFTHKWSMIMLNHGYQLPIVTRNPDRLKSNPNNWAAWLKESKALREKTIAIFNSFRGSNVQSVENMLQHISTKKPKGTGKLFHIAGVAKWMSMLK